MNNIFIQLRRYQKLQFILITIILILLQACTSSSKASNNIITISNFYQVSQDIYRSSQPSKIEMQQLEAMGIKTVINLRRMHSDRDEAENTNLKLIWIPMRAGNINDKNMTKLLQAIAHAEKPILIHCWHGSDRTGSAIAMYRMFFENWTKEQAIAELKQPEYGYHASYYPNIEQYLRQVDLEKIRQNIILIKK